MPNMNQYDKLSLVDFLNTMNQDSSFDNRKRLYKSLYFYTPVDYTGTAKQNTELANALRDTYKQVGSNLGERPRGDAFKQFANRTFSRSIYEGNRPTIRKSHPMESLEYRNDFTFGKQEALNKYLFGNR